MCYQYLSERTPETERIAALMKRSSLVHKWHQTSAVIPYGEINPSDVVPVIASNKFGKKSVFPMRWGLPGKSPRITVHMENIKADSTISEAWDSHRCIVPASYYYETHWGSVNNDLLTQRQKYLVQTKDSMMTWMCGIYQIVDGLPHFAILTRRAAPNIRFLHERMPLIMPDSLVDEWIRPDADPAALAEQAVTNMFYDKAPDESMTIRPIFFFEE